MLNKEDIKQYFFDALKNGHHLWSYDTAAMKASDLSDEFLIERVLLYLDIPELNLLFAVYPKEQIKEVFDWKICPLGPQYDCNNIFLAKIYFDIENADRYVKTQRKKGVQANLGYGRNTAKN